MTSTHPSPPAIPTWLPITLLALGGLCMIGGVALAILRILEPDKTAISLPTTFTSMPIMPTPGSLPGLPIIPPPLNNNSAPQIMPVMEVVQAATASAAPQLRPTPPCAAKRTPTPVHIPATPSATITAMQSASPTTTRTLAASMTPTAMVAYPVSLTLSLSPWPTFSPDTDFDLNLDQIKGRVTPAPTAPIPELIKIPAIGLDAPVVGVGWEPVNIGGQIYSQWQVPEQYASGWHNTSASPGQPGNTVLNGHHNAWGRVFSNLVDVEPGDSIILQAGQHEYRYLVVQTMILPERDQPLAVRLANARWLLPSPDERVTLVTCWPENDNSHRLVVVALPADEVQRWLNRQQFDQRNWQQPEP